MSVSLQLEPEVSQTTRKINAKKKKDRDIRLARTQTSNEVGFVD